MKILVAGAGAIGGTVAVILKRAGNDVRIFCRSRQSKKLIEEKGFFLHGAKGEMREDFICYDDISQAEGESFPVIIIATKYQAMTECARQVLPLLSDSGIVVGMQNGLLTQELAKTVGTERAVGCMIGFGATRNGINDVTMTSKGEFYLGMPDGRCPQVLEDFACELQKVLPTRLTDDIEGRQYSKLIINSCINAVAGITGRTLGEILKDERAVNLFLKIAREGMAVADGMGLRVPKYGVLLEYRLLKLGNGKIYNSLCKAVVRMVGRLYADVRPSTLQSIERGEMTEIDVLNGYFVEKGREYGVSVPVNERLVEMIHEIERRERIPTPDNLSELE